MKYYWKTKSSRYIRFKCINFKKKFLDNQKSLTFFIFFRDAAFGEWMDNDYLVMDNEQRHTKKLKDDKLGMKINWRPRPILAKELTQYPILEKSFIGVLKDKKNISKAISCLTTCLPCPQHLKRCSGLRIYLAPVHKSDNNPENLKNILIQSGFDLSLLENDFDVVEVTSEAPKTKSQMIYASKFWPVNFHPDLRLEALISGSLFDNEQLISLETCMRLAILAAEKIAVGSIECNGSAVIINPYEGVILSIAASSLDKHPMWHASMLAIDLVAKIQGGGTWNLIDDSENKLNTAKRKYTESLPLCYPNSLITNIDVPENGTLIFMKKDQIKTRTSELKVDEKCGPYLCTGYWAILLQEPCPLCSMALLHSRISRIFYGAANQQTGILGSKEILHSVPGLNHRYQVWNGVLEDECMKTLEKCRRIDS